MVWRAICHLPNVTLVRCAGDIAPSRLRMAWCAEYIRCLMLDWVSAPTKFGGFWRGGKCMLPGQWYTKQSPGHEAPLLTFPNRERVPMGYNHVGISQRRSVSPFVLYIAWHWSPKKFGALGPLSWVWIASGLWSGSRAAFRSDIRRAGQFTHKVYASKNARGALTSHRDISTLPRLAQMPQIFLAKCTRNPSLFGADAALGFGHSPNAPCLPCLGRGRIWADMDSIYF